MKTVIMAGGKGTRIAKLNADVPKPMIRLCGKPILQRQIDCLKKQGMTDITMVVGHLGHVIQDYFADGAQFGVKIDYLVETEPLGTAGALYYLKDKVRDDFLLINGDILFDVDIQRFLRRHKELGAAATLFTHPNDHPYDSAVLVADEHGRVREWLHKEEARTWYKNRVNAGLHMLSPKILDYFHTLRKTDLDRDILKPIIPEGTLYVYDSPEYVRDVGTPDRYRQAERDIQSGVVAAKSLHNKQKAVFLDRDGTINRHVGFLRNIDDFELLPGAADMIRRINKSGYLAIVVTNQPVIARGEVSWEELSEIHNKMETLLGQQGAYVDDIFVCPHHPDKGFAGERAEYKINCSCRKPKPGMLLQAAQKYNVDLRLSWMVGDSKSDMEAGRAAGCQCYCVHTQTP
ncbi:MAG: HAD-IIIA family hydrolase [Oscillospiraceae bacterium]|jgi:histidinol-phosphate phosphatase family protein